MLVELRKIAATASKVASSSALDMMMVILFVMVYLDCFLLKINELKECCLYDNQIHQ